MNEIAVRTSPHQCWMLWSSHWGQRQPLYSICRKRSFLHPGTEIRLRAWLRSRVLFRNSPIGKPPGQRKSYSSGSGSPVGKAASLQPLLVICIEDGCTSWVFRAFPESFPKRLICWSSEIASFFPAPCNPLRMRRENLTKNFPFPSTHLCIL